MSIYSMTGYATAQAEGSAPGERPAPRLGLEIRSVNSRFLDLSFRLSEDLRQHEPALRELLQTRLKRGKVEVRGGVEPVVCTDDGTRRDDAARVGGDDGVRRDALGDLEGAHVRHCRA